jgi:hypothetical protein
LAYNFQNEIKKIKPLMEYENETQKKKTWQRCTRRIDIWEKI